MNSCDESCIGGVVGYILLAACVIVLIIVTEWFGEMNKKDDE